MDKKIKEAIETYYGKPLDEVLNDEVRFIDLVMAMETFCNLNGIPLDVTPCPICHETVTHRIDCPNYGVRE